MESEDEGSREAFMRFCAAVREPGEGGRSMSVGEGEMWC